jgi:hypothetical protein
LTIVAALINRAGSGDVDTAAWQAKAIEISVQMVEKLAQRPRDRARSVGGRAPGRVDRGR